MHRSLRIFARLQRSCLNNLLIAHVNFMRDLMLNSGINVRPTRSSKTSFADTLRKEEEIKTILHLCADLGSDSKYYQLDPKYNVIMVGENIGVENFTPPKNVHGIIANPVCTEFSTAKGFHKENDIEKGMFLVKHCQRIIELANPVWWVIENPANGLLRECIGKPKAVYQPWQYGSPWTKKTALWGNFTMPEPLYTDWEYCPKNPALYVRPGRPKPALAFLHKSAVNLIPEMQWAKDKIKCDADIRSMCSNGFAKAFYLANK